MSHLLLSAVADFEASQDDLVLNPKTTRAGGGSLHSFSSAAHVVGRRLVSSETCTWLREHFHVSLADARRVIDTLFVAGINHHVYHGTAYSPQEAPWPGWLFYASTQFNPPNTIWRDLPVLNSYVTRCQSILQAGQPDEDLLVYFPFHDVLTDQDREFGDWLAIHGDWLKDLQAKDTFRTLWRLGYGFDYISDAQIAKLSLHDGTLVTAGGATYRTVVIPPCRSIPLETLETLLRLTESGAEIVFLAPQPTDVPGLGDLDRRRERLRELKTRVKTHTDIVETLAAMNIQPQLQMEGGELAWLRRRHEWGRDIFVWNSGRTSMDGWAELNGPSRSILLMEPMSGQIGRAEMRREDTACKVRLQLDPGSSCILRTFDTLEVDAPPWPYYRNVGPSFEPSGPWHVEFIAGGPTLPDGYETDALRSWTAQGGEAERFAGTARYSVTFDLPMPHPDWRLDLGEVHASAHIRINGRDAGTLLGPTFSTTLTGLQPTGNRLDVEVTNLAANRIRDLDRRGVEWRIFEDINFVSRDYGPFDATDWPLSPSGLLGPVRFTPVSM